MAAINVPTPGDDSLTGTPGTDIIDALAGNDDVNVFGGDDTVFGRAGFDAIEGGPGNDVLFGGEQLDILTGDADDDELFGDGGNDLIFGGGGNDTADGGEGADDIKAGQGMDFVFGGAGNDTLRGDAGDDEVFGGIGNDRVFGNLGNDFVDGGLGADRAFGGLGDDTVLGGGGQDTVQGDDGNDDVFGGQGDDRVDGNDGDDTVRGDGGNDRVFGGDGNDRVFGNIGDDRLFGNEGNDTLFGGQGDDTAFGGFGNDRFFVDADTGADSINGNADFDTLRFDTDDEELAQILANEAAEYLAGDTSVAFDFTGGHSVVNIEAIDVFANGQRVEAQEDEQVIIDFEEFEPFDIFPSPGPFAAQEGVIAQPLPPFLGEAVESQGFVINVNIVGTSSDFVVIPSEVENPIGEIPTPFFDNVAGANSFPIPLIEAFIFDGPFFPPELLPPETEIPRTAEIGMELPPFDPFLIFEGLFVATAFLGNLSNELPGAADTANGFLEAREGLLIGDVIEEFARPLERGIGLIEDELGLEPGDILTDPLFQDVVEFVSMFTLEELLGFGADLLDLLPDFAAPLFITSVDGDAFALEQADLAIDAGFALAVGSRNGQVVGVEVIQTPSPFLSDVAPTNGMLFPGFETPETTVTFDATEFGNVDFVDIISIGNVTIDNIFLNDAYEVIDFEGLIEEPIFERTIGITGEDPNDGTTLFDGFVFEGGSPVLVSAPSLFDLPIGPVLPPEPEQPTMNDISVAEELIDPFFANTALVSGPPLGLEIEKPVQPSVAPIPEEGDALFFVIDREDGATFDLESMLIGAESGEVEAVALLDGEVVGSQSFNVTDFFNAGTLVEFGDSFEGIDEVHLLSSGEGIIIDDLQVENIGEPEDALV
ncbi:MAG: calcium-binding protein [Pseudomonadota bacterium]